MHPKHPSLRIALVDDHEVVGLGLSELVRRLPGWELTAVVRRVVDLDLRPGALDLVLLDLRLDDGSSPSSNVARLHSAGLPVLAFTAGEDPALLRDAARAGILGVIRKAESSAVILDAIEKASRGEAVASTDWAAAIDADTTLADAALSPREREVLTLYASGETALGVAEITGLSRDTVANYVGRIRSKYARVGRPATNKVDLHVRATEDGLLTAREEREAR